VSGRRTCDRRSAARGPACVGMSPPAYERVARWAITDFRGGAAVAAERLDRAAKWARAAAMCEPIGSARSKAWHGLAAEAEWTAGQLRGERLPKGRGRSRLDGRAH